MMPLEDLKDFSMQHISNKDSKRSLFHSLSNNVNTYPSWWNSSASNCPKNTFNNTESHAQHASQVKHCFGTGIVDQDSSSTQSTDQSHQLGSSEGNLKQQCIPAQSGNDNSYDKHVDGQMKSILSLGTPEVAFQHPQIEYNSSTGCLPYTYNDQYYGSFLAAFGPRAVIYPGVWYLGFFNGLGPERTQSKMVHSALMLAGFEMEVVKTTSAGHAKKLASTVDYSSCPDGIICVGGDGIVNEGIFHFLEAVAHERDNQKEPFSIPIGIIPVGSDNSLVWTILGVRDPVSAAMTIVKGGFTPTDVFAVEWIQNGIIHYGTTVSYYGFLSDVLELSEKYQKRFGPLRYFVAGFLKFLCLPQFSFDLEYLPASTNISNDMKLENRSKTDMSDLLAEVLRRSGREGLPRASSLSTIDSVMTPSRMSGDLDTTTSALPSNEPSEFVRCLDPKSKRLSSTRSNLIQEPEEVIRPQVSLSSTPNYPRTRSKSRGDKGLTGLSINTTSDSRLSWANDKEEISSTISDPGPIWDYEPKWDPEAHWDESENPIEFQGPPDDIEQGAVSEFVPILDEKWVVKKGTFLGVLVCNHSCKTVQSLSSQVVAPKAVHDDNTLDLLMVKGSGRFRLLRFFILLQFGRHLSLPYVEYVKVKSVKLKATKNNQNGCGIDGELIKNNGQVICYLLPEQCRLIGRRAKNVT